MNRIEDYAVIGDCHSLALVGADGSIDWACFPRFDSPSVFARVLDQGRGGHFAMHPEREVSRRRSYLEDTNVLVTTFACEGGRLEVTDCMPVAPLDPASPATVAPRQSILRRLRVVEGTVSSTLELAPRFEYGAVVPRFTATSAHSVEIVGGASALWVRATAGLRVDDEAVTASWSLGAGEEIWVEAAWTPSHGRVPGHGDDRDTAADLARRLDETLGFWRAWMGRCSYRGEHEAAVRRSALVLKSLVYAPSGAVVAAPTTSLPETIGGERNWDYRYTWIRDATLTLISLFTLGYTAEADAFKTWLERTGAGRPDDLQIMYGIAGERLLPELTLDHLDGHQGSAPVRIGNGAASQRQLDSYGQILEAAWLYARTGGTLTESNWRFLAGLADLTVRQWRTPDHGIWEMRDRPRHFVHSKLHCWLALDRAGRLAQLLDLPGDVRRWRRERDVIRTYLVEEGAPHGWFRQAIGVDAADASVLAVPALGFLPTCDPLVAETITVVQRDLTTDGLVHRYLFPDGLEGGEGAFLLCSFWLLDCLTWSGRLSEAEALLDRLLGLANDVGILPEEVDPVSGAHLGNTPQAFTHMALVTSCAHLAAAKEGRLDGTVATDYAEAALDHLAASR